MDKCAFCKKEIQGNPKFVIRYIQLKRTTMLGYTDLDFCSLDCFLNYIFEKHRKKFEKKYL